MTVERTFAFSAERVVWDKAWALARISLLGGFILIPGARATRAHVREKLHTRAA